MISVRHDLFETNSSSVHTLTFSGKLEPFNLTVKEGYVITQFGKFDKFGGVYTQDEKLSYLISLLWYCCGDTEHMMESYRMENIKDALSSHVGYKILGIKIGEDLSEPYIDHQSIPELGEIHIVDCYNIDSIKQFIFNPNISVVFSCD